MRNRPSNLTHKDYAVCVLTDAGETVRPIYRVQSKDSSGDFSTEPLYELGNEGYVQIKENTPVMTFTFSGNLVAQEIDSNTHALQWASNFANGDPDGDDAKEAIFIGRSVYYQNGEIHTPGVSPITSSGDVSFNQVGGNNVTRIAAIFWTQEDASIKNISFRMKKANAPPADAKIRVGLATCPSGVITNFITWATAYSYSDSLASETRWLATTDRIDSGDLITSYTRQFNAYFNSSVKLLGNTQYAIVWDMNTVGTYDHSSVNLINIACRDTNVSGGNCSRYYNLAWTNNTAIDVWFSLGGSRLGYDFDYSTYGDDDQAISGSYGLENVCRVPYSIDLLVPIRGRSELNRVNYFAQCQANSLSLSYDVGGMATWDVGVETDNRSGFIGDRKGVEIRSIEVCLYGAGDNANVNTTITLNSVPGVKADTLDFPSGAIFDTVYQIYLNGMELEQATTNAQLNALGVIRWCIPDSETDQIAFTVNTLVENDIIRVVYNPTNEPTWSTAYELFSEPGDQGGLTKSELDINLITDTTIPRVIEGMAITDADEEDYYEIDITPGSCYVDVDEGIFDVDLPGINPELEIFRLTIPQTMLLSAPTVLTTVNDSDTIPANGGSITVTVTLSTGLEVGQEVMIVDEDSNDNWAVGMVTGVAGNDITINFWYVTATFDLNNGVTDDEIYIVSRYLVLRSDRYGNALLSVTNDDETTIKVHENDVASDELLLAQIVLGWTGGVNDDAIVRVTDMREFHRNTLSLIQTASQSADMGREVIYELGNKRAIDRNLNKPVPITADLTAKDVDEEIEILLHETEILDIIAAANENIFTASEATSNAGFTNCETGDFICARGSIGVIQSRINSSILVISKWYGGIPLDGSSILTRRGVLKSSEMSSKVGIQVNLYTDPNREESDKKIIIESKDMRPSSDSISISTGGSGELSVSLNGDNLRLLIAASAPASWV